MLVDEVGDDLFVDLDDLFRGTPAVWYTGGIGQVNYIFIRKLAGELLQDRKSANPGIKYPDGGGRGYFFLLRLAGRLGRDPFGRQFSNRT